MKKRILLALFTISLLTSCGVQFQYTTLNHAGHIDGIYASNDYKIDTLNEFQVRNKLRTDFNFRYSIAQYALSQPASFDWNNRLLGNRYNWNRPYWGYSYYWNRTQMWNDWAWGYPYSNWGYNSWNRPYWGYNNSWWNGYNSWYQGPWNNPGYNVIWNSSRQNNNIAYINGRRGSNITNYNNRTISNSIIRKNSKPRNNVNNVRIINKSNNDQIIRNNPRTNWSTESSGNGRWSRSRQNIPVKPTVPIITTPNQPRQIYRGSRSSSVQQPRGGSTSSRQNSGGTSRQRD